MDNVKRGELYFADLSPVVGSEQGSKRLVCVLQNDIGNQFSPTVIVASITSKINKAKLPTHVLLSNNEYPLDKTSVIMTEQIRTIDKQRLKWRVTNLHDETMEQVDHAMKISLGLIDINTLTTTSA